MELKNQDTEVATPQEEPSEEVPQTEEATDEEAE